MMALISVSSRRHRQTPRRVRHKLQIDDGVAICWGSNDHGQAAAPKDEKFVLLSSGGNHTCGLREDGVIVCWGDNKWGQSSPPLR